MRGTARSIKFPSFQEYNFFQFSKLPNSQDDLNSLWHCQVRFFSDSFSLSLSPLGSYHPMTDPKIYLGLNPSSSDSSPLPVSTQQLYQDPRSVSSRPSYNPNSFTTLIAAPILFRVTFTPAIRHRNDGELLIVAKRPLESERNRLTGPYDEPGRCHKPILFVSHEVVQKLAALGFSRLFCYLSQTYPIRLMRLRRSPLGPVEDARGNRGELCK